MGQVSIDAVVKLREIFRILIGDSVDEWESQKRHSEFSIKSDLEWAAHLLLVHKRCCTAGDGCNLPHGDSDDFSTHQNVPWESNMFGNQGDTDIPVPVPVSSPVPSRIASTKTAFSIKAGTSGFHQRLHSSRRLPYALNRPIRRRGVIGLPRSRSRSVNKSSLFSENKDLQESTSNEKIIETVESNDDVIIIKEEPDYEYEEADASDIYGDETSGYQPQTVNNYVTTCGDASTQGICATQDPFTREDSFTTHNAFTTTTTSLDTFNNSGDDANYDGEEGINKGEASTMISTSVKVEAPDVVDQDEGDISLIAHTDQQNFAFVGYKVETETSPQTNPCSSRNLFSQQTLNNMGYNEHNRNSLNATCEIVQTSSSPPHIRQYPDFHMFSQQMITSQHGFHENRIVDSRQGNQPNTFDMSKNPTVSKLALNQPLPSLTKRDMALYMHMDKLTCRICERRYSSLSNLKSHMRIHWNDRRYMCLICSKTFIYRHHLSSHMNVHATNNHAA